MHLKSIKNLLLFIFVTFLFFASADNAFAVPLIRGRINLNGTGTYLPLDGDPLINLNWCRRDSGSTKSPLMCSLLPKNDVWYTKQRCCLVPGAGGTCAQYNVHCDSVLYDDNCIWCHGCSQGECTCEPRTEADCQARVKPFYNSMLPYFAWPVSCDLYDNSVQGVSDAYYPGIFSKISFKVEDNAPSNINIGYSIYIPPTPTLTITPTVTATPTPTVTNTPTPTITKTPTPTVTKTPTPTITVTPTVPQATFTPTPTITKTPTPTITKTPTPTITKTPTPTTPQAVSTPTTTVTPTKTSTPTITVTPTVPQATFTPTPTITKTPTPTTTVTPTSTRTPTPTIDCTCFGDYNCLGKSPPCNGLLCVIGGCNPPVIPTDTPIPTVTITPTLTPTPTMTATPTPIPPTVTNTPTSTATPTPTSTVTPTPAPFCDCDRTELLSATVAPGETVTFRLWMKTSSNAEVREIVFNIWTDGKQTITPLPPPDYTSGVLRLSEEKVVKAANPTPVTEDGKYYTDWYYADWDWTVPFGDAGFSTYYLKAMFSDSTCGLRTTASLLNTSGQVAGTTTTNNNSWFNKTLTLLGNIVGLQAVIPSTPTPTQVPTKTPTPTPDQMMQGPPKLPLGGYCAGSTLLAPSGVRTEQLGTFSPFCPSPTPEIAKGMCHEMLIKIYNGE